MNSGNIKVHWLKDKDIFLVFDNKATERHVNFYKKLRNVQFFFTSVQNVVGFCVVQSVHPFLCIPDVYHCTLLACKKKTLLQYKPEKKINHINKSPFR